MSQSLVVDGHTCGEKVSTRGPLHRSHSPCVGFGQDRHTRPNTAVVTAPKPVPFLGTHMITTGGDFWGNENKCIFINIESTFGSVSLDGVPGPRQLAHHI